MTTKVTQKVVKMSQERLEDLRQSGIVSEDQIQKMIDLDFISGKKRSRRVMETSDGGYTQPSLSFVGNGKNTPYTSSMVDLKNEFGELLEKYTTLQKV